MSEVSHNYSRQVKMEGDKVIKTYKGLFRGNPWPAFLPWAHDKVHSSPTIRYLQEDRMLRDMGKDGYKVPEMISSDGESKTIITRKIDDLVNVRDILENPETPLEYKLPVLEACAGYVREMHENDYIHGNPFLHSFGMTDGDTYGFDFEFQPNPKMYPTHNDRKLADVNEIMWSAVQLLANDLDKGDISPVLDTIGSENGYGFLPDGFRSTPWVCYELVADPRGPKRPDLYKALKKFKG